MKDRIYIYISRMNSEKESHEKLYRAVGCYLQEKDGMIPDHTAWHLERSPQGKPYFPEAPWLHFSISHSGAFWSCAVSGQPVGLDLQIRKETGTKKGKNRTERIAARFFHPQEMAAIANGVEFYDIWAAKESYVKYTGRGLGEGFETFWVADGTGMLPYVNVSPSPSLILLSGSNAGTIPPEMTAGLEGYSFCLCAEKTGEVILVSME